MRKKSLKLWPILILLAFPLIIATVVHSGETPGVTDTSIRIGMLGSFSGPFFPLGYPMINGARMIYRKVNDEGGIHGRKIETILEDDGALPGKALAAAKKLVAQDDVFMIHGSTASNAGVAAKPEIERAGIPWMIFAASSDNLTNTFCKTTFTTMVRGNQTGISMADFAMSIPGVKKVAVISQHDAWGRPLYESLHKTLKEKYGITPVADIVVEPDISDSTPQVLKIKEAKADVICLIVYDRAGFVIFKDAYVHGLRGVPYVAGPAQTDLRDMLLTKVGNYEAIKNVCAFTPYVRYSLDDPHMEKWIKLRKQYFPEDANLEINFAGTGGALVIVEALKKCGRELTREKFIGALESIKNFETDFYVEPISFSSTDHVGIKAGSFKTFAERKKIVYIGSKWVNLKKD